MNNLLALGKDLEQKSKAQQQTTAAMLKAAFSEHEQSVKQELTSSAKRISDAISAHEKGMTEAMQSNRLSVMRMVGRTWLTITMVSGLLFASLSGVLWYQGSLIASNLSEIDQQNAALSALNAKTWGVTHLEDRNGRFLVLPNGMKAEAGWTVNNGKRNAVKLVKE
ncbi:MbeB family mobilization protein [Salmonella enterica subsp. enterica serovar Montevideo]|nr:MbeB family mobilization protein [Salmonella enterica subsp. enterica serovar Montevideo]